MKKKMLFAVLCSALLLSGCSGIESFLDEQIKSKSGIAEDVNYQTYQTYSDGGKLDSEGYYSEAVFETEGEDGIVSPSAPTISFSRNSFLNVKYYLDEGRTQEIVASQKQIPVGSSIYADVSLDNSVPSTTYDFSGFRLYEVEVDGDRGLLNTLTLDENGLLLAITAEYEGKDLVIVPVGEYSTREVSLKSSYIDVAETEHNLAGTWYVNDTPISGTSAEINPISSYIISYDFDGSRYFYLSSEPECYYSNNEDGVIIFNKREATDETLDYEVKLHEYLTVKIRSNELRHVKINNGANQEINAGNDLEIPRLKYGDSVVIITDKPWNEIKNCKDLVCISDEDLTYLYKYTMTVPEKGAEFRFDPSEYTYDHGEVSFFCMGSEVTSPVELAQGRTIIYEQKNADSGYRLPDGNHEIVVSTSEQTRDEIENIHFIESVDVKVSLPQPKYGGEIEYYVEGKRIYSPQFSCDSGTVITMKFAPWEGWINKFNNGETYLVTDTSSQTVKIQNSDVDNAFEEDPNHKPELTIVLAKGLDENMRFTLEASGLDPNDYQYVPEWYRSDYTIISKHAIGTEKGISLSIGNSAIQAGTAIKIQVEKTGEDKSKTKTEKVTNTETRLVNSLAELQKPIEVYGPYYTGHSAVWYSTVKITISLVDVKTYTELKALTNSTVEVRKASTGEVLKTGNLLEGSEKVTITITPANGYYITGKSVKENLYQNTVEFKNLLSDAEKIISEHPVKKYVEVNLDATDSYGTCKFTVDNQVVSGKVYLKDGDKVSLEYKITDSAYVIDGASGLFGSSIGKNEKEKTETIIIDSTYDGKTLNRETFGIKVRKEA